MSRYQLMFCCRNSNGMYHEDGIERFCFYVGGQLTMSIDSVYSSPKRIGWTLMDFGRSIKIGRIVMPITDHQEHVGNIHWDSVNTTAQGLAKLAGYLYRSNNWRMDSGPIGLWHKGVKASAFKRLAKGVE